jgi:hypothetical protein
VVPREVSKQPPWSMAMSTSTEPWRICRTMSRVTSLGAAAPGTSTAPITRSAVMTLLSMESTVEKMVLSMGPNCRSSS